MKKLFTVLLFVLTLLTVAATPVSAKRILPRAKSPSLPAGTTSRTSSSGGPGVSVKIRGDRLAIVTTFTNLSSASNVSYMFSYNTRGTTQGASGSISVSENNTSREIIFGTCSHGVCRYDSGISGAKFVVTIKLPNGKRIIKTFRIRI